MLLILHYIFETQLGCNEKGNELVDKNQPDSKFNEHTHTQTHTTLTQNVTYTHFVGLTSFLHCQHCQCRLLQPNNSTENVSVPVHFGSPRTFSNLLCFLTSHNDYTVTKFYFITQCWWPWDQSDIDKNTCCMWTLDTGHWTLDSTWTC